MTKRGAECVALGDQECTEPKIVCDETKDEVSELLSSLVARAASDVSEDPQAAGKVDLEKNETEKEVKEDVCKEQIAKTEQKPTEVFPPENASCVVHISSIPQDVPDQKLAFIGLSFGDLQCILYLKNKGQAFLSFTDIGDATRMVNYFARFTPILLGSRLHVQFSNHKQINLSQMSPSVAHTQLALKYAKKLKLKSVSGEVGSVVRLLIHDMIMGVAGSITVDTLYQIFTKFGPVLKIVIAKRTASSLLAFIQMFAGSDVDSAINELHNHCLFGGGFSQCSVEKARAPRLNINANCARYRDYTNPCQVTSQMIFETQYINADVVTSGPIPTVDLTDDMVEYVPTDESKSSAAVTSVVTSTGSGGSYAGAAAGGIGGSKQLHHFRKFGGAIPDESELYNCVEKDDPTVENHQLEEEQAASAAAMYAAAAAAASRSTMGGSEYATSMNPFGLRTALAAAAAFFDSTDADPTLHNPMSNTFVYDNSMFANANIFTARPRVVLVSNLDPKQIDADKLFILFGVYGDVKRVKILFNKQDTALIQFTNPDQAQTALRNLDGITIFGKAMKVTFSKHPNIQRLKETETSELTKEYEDSALHRFKKPGSKNYTNIYPPNCSLHLSNISDNMTEEDILKIFRSHGQVERFRFFEHDKHMASITMDTIENACHALMACHNHLLPRGRYLRVSFSKPRHFQ